jgi:hypothetical protein
MLRYYDIDRDYQPGLQRASGQPRPGQPASVELPAVLNANDAPSLIETIARRANWARQSLAWRTAELDPAVRPGSLVRVPGQSGVWRINDWEWRDSGIELTLWRIPAEGSVIGDTIGDAGRANIPADMPVGPTRLVAFELPWDGTGAGDTPLLFAAASSPSETWNGAALFVDHGDGQLLPLGPSGRMRSTIGSAITVLPAAAPHLFDRASTVVVELAAQDQALTDASARQLCSGTNSALLGEEIIQFASITLRPLTPVHARSKLNADGSMSLSWTRRAFGDMDHRHSHPDNFGSTTREPRHPDRWCTPSGPTTRPQRGVASIAALQICLISKTRTSKMSEPISFESASPRFGLPLLFAGQAQKEAFVNEAISLTDALLHCAVEGIASAPPATAAEGTAWLVAASPTGEWAGKAGHLACRQARQWLFVQPRDGMRVLNRTTGQDLRRADDTWKVPSMPAAPTGGATIDVEVRTALTYLMQSLRDAGVFSSE